MIKHILLPIDLTAPSENMVRNAIYVCQKTRAKLSLLHIFRLPQPLPVNSPNAGAAPVQPYDHYMDSEIIAEEKSTIQSKVKKMTEKLPELNDIEMEVVTSTGLIVEQVSDFANKNQVDLILMETSGASGLKEIFIGTHSEETTRKAPCPVLIFPEDQRAFSIRNICIAVDNNVEEYRGRLPVLKNIASIYDAGIHVIHIEDKPESEIQYDHLERSLKEIFQGANFTFNILKSENVEESIFAFTENNNIDLLALLYHKQNLFNRLLKKSVTTNVAYHSEIPLLVLK